MWEEHFSYRPWSTQTSFKCSVEGMGAGCWGCKMKFYVKKKILWEKFHHSEDGEIKFKEIKCPIPENLSTKIVKEENSFIIE
jgi:hypothetical protein